MHTFLRPSGKNLQRFPDSKSVRRLGRPPGRGPRIAADRRRPAAGSRNWWTLQTLRPPGDTEALPLDDPENDPQRLAAVQMLREMLKK